MNIVDAIVWAEIGFIWLLFVFQPITSRKVIAFVYGFTLMFHGVLNAVTPDILAWPSKDLWFFLFGGGLDLAVILFISNMKETSRLAGDIQDISLVSIMFNILGLALAYIGAESELYMGLFVVLYIWAIHILIRGEPKEDGHFKIDTRFLALNSHAHSWMPFCNKEKK